MGTPGDKRDLQLELMLLADVHQTLTVFGHIAHGLAGALVDNPGPDRHFYRHVFTVTAAMSGWKRTRT
jgi:hypothetical protein